MADTTISILEELRQQPDLLTFNRGIEREALRVAETGNLASTPHPEALGSKLTHPLITTDFSESQLELITPVQQSPAATLEKLEQIHQEVYSHLPHEVLWSASMPCVLQDDSSIPLANFGSSNLGRLKTCYRSGLGYRYGRGMQTICAVHYNFSFSDAFWRWLHQFERSDEPMKDYVTRRYFDLMRNFRRYSWLLTYLFGASPAVCNSFVRGKSHQLETFDESTAYLPHATSLRSGNLGYQSDTQANNMKICYNSLPNYVQTLASAICTPHEPYQALGVHVGDQYRQVNGNILQSEAEFYSSIRAKRVPGPGENFLACLEEKGVQYIEVRLLDVNPYLPMGIDETEIRFLDVFLLHCLLTPSPAHDDALCNEVNANSQATVLGGRAPGLTLSDNGIPRTLQSWALSILDAAEPIATFLDTISDETADGLAGDAATSNAKAAPINQDAMNSQREKIMHPELTPSGQILAQMQREEIPFFRFAMNQAQQHKAHFTAAPRDAQAQSEFAELAKQSVEAQRSIEAADSVSFDDYLAAIAAKYTPLCGEPS